MNTAGRGMARFVVWSWLRFSQYSWRHLPTAQDSPHVHAPGANPDRLLIVGDGASAGVGVTTHDLGLGGYLARSLSLITGRATDVDIVVRTDMTARSCIDAVREVDLSRFDLILVSLGVNEVLRFEEPEAWSRAMSALLDQMAETASAATVTVVLSIPLFVEKSQFPSFLGQLVDRHASQLNEISKRVIRGRDSVTYFPFTPSNDLESEGAHTYQRWAAGMAPTLSKELGPRDSTSPRTEAVEESRRQAALDTLGLVSMPEDMILNQITAIAQNLFDVSIAAVTFIDNDLEIMPAAVGIDPIEVARSESFCDTTIRRAQHFTVEDALLHPDFATKSMVIGGPKVRFYAGYPIEARDGSRIGALCIMDPQPRPFSTHDASLLRNLAKQVQARLWQIKDDMDTLAAN
jgi:GAF domain-containing protein